MDSPEAIRVKREIEYSPQLSSAMKRMHRLEQCQNANLPNFVILTMKIMIVNPASTDKFVFEFWTDFQYVSPLDTLI